MKKEFRYGEITITYKSDWSDVVRISAPWGSIALPAPAVVAFVKDVGVGQGLSATVFLDLTPLMDLEELGRMMGDDDDEPVEA